MQDLILTAIGAFVGCMVGELLSKRKKTPREVEKSAEERRKDVKDVVKKQ